MPTYLAEQHHSFDVTQILSTVKKLQYVHKPTLHAGHVILRLGTLEGIC